MLLSETQKNIIKTTWALVKSCPENSNAEIGRAIFIRLFELAPETLQLFPFRDESMEELQTSKRLGRHGASFVRQIEKTIEHMDQLFSESGPRLVALGIRHYTHGAEDPHYEVAGECFLHVLKNTLQAEYSPEIEDAFTSLYAVISEAMQEGGRDH